MQDEQHQRVEQAEKSVQRSFDLGHFRLETTCNLDPQLLLGAAEADKELEGGLAATDPLQIGPEAGLLSNLQSGMIDAFKVV